MRRRFAVAIAGTAFIAVVVVAAGPLMSEVEQPAYRVERSDGPIELRAYPAMIVAETTVRGSRDAAIRQGFRILAGYIFGANAGAKKIEMTAPVTQERSGSGASATEMTELTPGSWTVRFGMPRAWSLDTLPKPKDDQVRLTRTAPGTFAVIRFSGFARDAALKAKTSDLLAFIKKAKLEPVGQPIFAFYNPPWTLPFFRRNEVSIEVRPS